ncbi:MAG: hypothetical protein DSZ10_02535 [Sulfurovum sp.]|nr:MAG: hypothetical protein DSZ10_02535 [Sulfurovum sp.]
MRHSRDGISYSPREARIKNKESSFAQKRVTFDDTPLFFPEGFEKLFLLIYFITLPYIAGLLFLFFYVADGKKKLFLSVNSDTPFMAIWAIGYEILAVLILLWIVKSAIAYSYESRQRGSTPFRRP